MPKGMGKRFRPLSAKAPRRAVALRYDESLPAPFLIAKGAGSSADRMRDIAREFGIPVLADENLAGFLFPLEPGQMVPEEYWEIVAKVYVYIAELVGK